MIIPTGNYLEFKSEHPSITDNKIAISIFKAISLKLVTIFPTETLNADKYTMAKLLYDIVGKIWEKIKYQFRLKGRTSCKASQKGNLNICY